LKNKTKTSVLGLLVLGIWGTIGYKIISGINPTQPSSDNSLVTPDFALEYTKEKDSFKIINLDRDPFLGTILVSKKTNKTVLGSKKKEVNFPEVVYKGILETNGSNNRIFILSINNKEYLLKKGQIADSVKLNYGNTKSVRVSYKNTSKTIKLNDID